MKIHLWSVGKPHEPYVKPGVELFTRRISHYFSIEWHIVPTPRHAATLSVNELKKAEGEQILRLILPEQFLVILDEKGKQLSTEQLADLIQRKANEGTRDILFLIGGAYGLDEIVKKRSNLTWSLSNLVFPHQLVRLILSEQVYRACTILKNEKYHHF